MKLNKWYQLKLLKRFMTKEELEEFQREYNKAKLVELGKITQDN